MFLMDEIDDTVKQLKKLDAQETSAQDAQKKAKNDQDYTQIVSELSNAIEKVSEASSKLGFIPSEDSIQIAEDAISLLEKVIYADVVDEDELISAQKQIRRRLLPRLAIEWKKYYQPKVAKTRAKLSSVSSLITDKNQETLIQKQISNAEEWTGLLFKDNGVNTRLEQLENAIESVNQIEARLDLSDGVRKFLELVTKGRAKVTDLNSEIIEWIQKEKLENKFAINFKN